MANNHEHVEGGHHVIPANLLLKILLWLFFLTILTVITAKFMQLGVLAVPVAIVIAVTKAVLVMSYFMGLKYETKINRAVFASGFVFLALLFFFCMLDIYSRYIQSSTL